MPLMQHFSPVSHIHIGIWEITESLSELLKIYGEFPLSEELEKFKNEVRKKQGLSVRTLLKELCKIKKLQFNGLGKDDFNKPFPKGQKYHLSISHTDKYAVAIINEKEAVGIDIEAVSTKVEKIKHKFLSEKELQKTANNLEEMAVYWSAKESLYKLYGKKKVLFNKELFIEKEKQQSNFTGKILKADLQKTVRMQWQFIDSFVLVYTL